MGEYTSDILQRRIDRLSESLDELQAGSDEQNKVIEIIGLLKTDLEKAREDGKKAPGTYRPREGKTPLPWLLGITLYWWPISQSSFDPRTSATPPAPLFAHRRRSSTPPVAILSITAYCFALL